MEAEKKIKMSALSQPTTSTPLVSDSQKLALYTDSHKTNAFGGTVHAVETAIRSAGATLEYLPAYSPDLNPIEKMWSKIKAFLRAAKARTSRALNAAIRKAFECITSDDALSWFASCGYTLS